MKSYIALHPSSRLGLALLLALSVQSCRAEPDAATHSWPIECVGRMQLRLPGPADTAATLNEEVRSFNYDVMRTKPSFADGTPAPFTNLWNGGVVISHQLRPEQKAKFLRFAEAVKQEVISRTLKEDNLSLKNSAFREVAFPSNEGVGWRYNDYLAATYFVNDHLVRWNGRVAFGERLLKARHRTISDVPKAPGLCLPYLFVPDDGELVRRISMSYRLKDHPDIQVTLTDASASRPADAAPGMDEKEVKHRNKLREPDPEIAGFWHMRLNAASLYESMWRLPSTTRPVTLAGYEGRQSFVRLTMDDGTTQNYGYYAVVRGDPDAAQDTPDLRLLVRQDVTQAQGKTPLNKQQFIDMAQAIAKSVQRRPVSPN